MKTRKGPPKPREWSPDSWTKKPIEQQPVYPDQAHLAGALSSLSRLPPLVTSYEIESLKTQIADAARGERFLLQGGDCSESFEDCESGSIAAKLKILLQMSLVLTHGCGRRVIRVGRFGGQYAKPRSSDMETRDGVTLPTYRGDMINRPGFTEAERRPDPELLLRGYGRAALTVNFIRALVDGGFADLHHPEYWALDFVNRSPHAGEYRHILDSIGQGLRFMETLLGTKVSEIQRVDFFTSHEGLHLHYEQAQTRQVPRRTGWYNLSTHLPWIGNRTRDPGGAHVEYFRGIRNPVGLKVDATLEPEAFLDLARILDPEGEPGRLTVIHRFGAEKVGKYLPRFIEAVRREGRTVLWCCDPMHGNTETLPGGVKTRRFEKILKELETAFRVHEEEGSHLGGVHFELTGDNVTECIGGACGLTEADLSRAYKTQVDPRLNYEQAMEMTMLLARLMSQGKKGG
jgi:3-deoxy-7-phosphoheptulonate synthase